MYPKKKLVALLFALLTINVQDIYAQKSGPVILDEAVRIPARREISLPNLPGYLTLKCDFHIHTVFSDGVVWPTVRVEEAWEDGLDAIAITDHIEGNPKKLPGQKHQAYEIALPAARAKNILLVKGGEISRGMPPGHFNALFVTDVNALDLPDYMDALKEAHRQGGFIFWNHPGWQKQQPDTTRWMAEHERIYQSGLMQGIEVFNEKEWYPEALQWAKEKKLTMMGNSDIHDVFNKLYDRELFPVRPITLVFARERTEASLKEALLANRTALLFFNKLIGPAEYVNPMVNQSIEISKPFLVRDGYLYFEMRNHSDIAFTLVKTGKESSELPQRTILPGRSVIVARAKQTAGKEATYTYQLENVLTGVDEHGILTFSLQ